MSSIAIIKPGTEPIRSGFLPTESVVPQWYVAQTCSHHEKRVAEQLDQRYIENFLPLYERVSRWKDRRVRLQVPLFDSYVFVHMALQERLRVLELPGVVRLVGFGGPPTALPDCEITSLRETLNRNIQAEPYPYFQVGRRVLIKSGPLAGLEGSLVRKRNQFRFVLSIELIQRSIIVDVDAADVVEARNSAKRPV